MTSKSPSLDQFLVAIAIYLMRSSRQSFNQAIDSMIAAFDERIDRCNSQPDKLRHLLINHYLSVRFWRDSAVTQSITRQTKPE